MGSHKTFRKWLRGGAKFYSCAFGFWFVAPFGWRPKTHNIVLPDGSRRTVTEGETFSITV